MRYRLIFLGIILLAAFFRLYLLAHIPNSLSADEVAFGYNAYSLLETGRDEFGYSYPLTFRSFDDYKNPVFGYVLIPFVALFGMTDWAIRLPSAIAGIGVVVISYFFTHELTKNRKLSLLTMLFAAFSPWLIQYSRVAIEMELAVFISLAAVLLFIKARTRPYLYMASSILFAISFYTYHSSKLWIALFGLVLVCIYRPFTKMAFFAALLFGLLCVPYVYLLATTDIGLRPYAISVFANQEEVNVDGALLAQDFNAGQFLPQFFHNRRFTKINQALAGYVKVLRPEILFAPDINNHVAQTRLLFLWQLPLIFFAFVLLGRNSKLFWLMFLWVGIGLVSGAFTTLPPFDRRILLISYPLMFLSAYTIYVVFNRYRTPYLRWPVVAVVSVVFLFSSGMYLHQFLVHTKTGVVELWGNGMKETVLATQQFKDQYTDIVVSLKLNQPLTFFLYYEKYLPADYLAGGGTISGGYNDERGQFGPYRFKYIDPSALKEDVLYVWSAQEALACLLPLETISQTDGTPFAYVGVFNKNAPICVTSAGGTFVE